MKLFTKLALGAVFAATATLGVAAPSTAATTAASPAVPAAAAAAPAASAKIVPAAACVAGIEYWTSSEWNWVTNQVWYYAHAKNCSSTNKHIQFYWQGGSLYGSCETVRPGATLVRQSITPFGGLRYSC